VSKASKTFNGGMCKLTLVKYRNSHCIVILTVKENGTFMETLYPIKPVS